MIKPPAHGQPVGRVIVDFVRHGESAAYAAESPDLTPRGIQQAKAAAREIAGLLQPKARIVVVSSPAPRAQDTAFYIHQVLRSQEAKMRKAKQSGAPRVYQSVIPFSHLQPMQRDAEYFQKYIDDYGIRNAGLALMNELKNLDWHPRAETPKQIKKRFERNFTYVRRIARSVRLPVGEHLHLIVVGHEELPEDLLSRLFGTTLFNPRNRFENGDRLRFAFNPFDKKQRVDISYKDKAFPARFDESKREFVTLNA